uniref:ABC transmembrane type-1 domain-containing protein n=1 Tax=Timema monikensis TaxID=170555 RepID=A0A7R9EDY9_9NEOP|nr:unnamed protein product [Timema monikensis]
MCRVVSTINSPSVNLSFLDRSFSLFIQVTPRLSSIGWVLNPSQTPLIHRRKRQGSKLGPVAGSSDSQTTEAVTTVASAPEVSGSIKEKNVLRRLMSSSSTKSSSAAMESVKTPVKRLLSTTSASSDDAYDEEDCLRGGERSGPESDEATDAGEGRTMSEEEREYGKIPKRIYLDYLCACGVVAGVSYLLSAVLWQGLRVYTDYWLSQWTHHSNATAVDHHEHPRQDETVLYFSVYASLSAASIILSLLSNGIGQYAGAQARRTLHDNMLHNLLKCPMKFFESTPVGRIINRFSMDTGLIDKKLATSIQRLLQFLLLCFSAILVNAVVTPWFLLAAVPICATYYVVQHFYRYSSRELQRLDSITRSPIFSHFSETLGGLTTIRAFSHQQRFTDMLLRKMDTHANAFLIMNTANRWLGIALVGNRTPRKENVTVAPLWRNLIESVRHI